MNNKKLENILEYLKEKRNVDFSGYREQMLERRIQKRFYTTNHNYDNYLDYLTQYDNELDQLIDVFTINVSNFFRNTLTFELIKQIIIPDIFASKVKEGNYNIRVWSAGCSFGEEPYSMAILLNEYIKNEETPFRLNIFATDIDKKALEKAKEASYSFNSIQDAKHGLVKEYFTPMGDQYFLNQQIKQKVQFSYYDLLDQKYAVPPDSIYGDFDIVLCRNVLIYLNTENQKIIFEKLYQSLKPNGYLILGEAEVPIAAYQHKFKRANSYCKIYTKNS